MKNFTPWDRPCLTPAAILRQMNPQLTEIAFVLDRSGSMSAVADAAIAGFNHFLAEQQRAAGQARLTVVLFDDEYLLHVDAIPVEEVLPLDETTFVPRNSTALLDAIGRTVDAIGERLHVTPEDVRPGHVIVAILTDGFENASTSDTWETVSKRIKHQTNKYGWEFLFLGAGQDAIATAAQLNIAAHNAAAFAQDAVGHVASSAGISRKTSARRAVRSGHASLEEQAAAEAPVQDLVREEDEKRR